MKVLVTGVGGFIGSKVARRFQEEGHAVTGADDFSGGRRENVPQGIELVEGDLAREETVARLPRDFELILHLAGQSSGEISFDDPVADLQKNTVATLRLIRHGIATGARRIVYASSMSVYGSQADAPTPESAPCQPLSCYGVGKLAAEAYLRIHSRQLPYVALRMFNVYGPGQDMRNLRQGMVSIYLAQALAGGNVQVKGGLERYRDFIYVDDVVEAWHRAARKPEVANRILNVGTGNRTTVQNLLEAMRNSIPAMRWFVEGSTPGDQSGIYADTKQMRDVLGMQEFVPLAEGLRRFVAWAK